MFGTVPKVLWERRAPADERNRITLGLCPLLVRTADEAVVIDSGVGAKMSDRDIELYAIDRRPPLDVSLATVGISASDITSVVATARKSTGLKGSLPASDPSMASSFVDPAMP